MKYSEEFKKLVKNCIKSGAHVGGGNPNAKILFVGKEAAYGDEKHEYNSNINEWNLKTNNPESQLHLEYNDTFPGGHTWKKYQNLHDYIFPEFKPDKGMMNFQKRIFTTEMNDDPAKRTKTAQSKIDFKIKLQERKDMFFTEDFIQNFDVVVLACSGYIVNNEKNYEINNLFKVKYVGDDYKTIDGLKGTKHYSHGNWYFLHLNTNKTKLVIHTRQLSSNVNDNLLKDMGKIIREHLEKNALL